MNVSLFLYDRPDVFTPVYAYNEPFALSNSVCFSSLFASSSYPKFSLTFFASPCFQESSETEEILSVRQCMREFGMVHLSYAQLVAAWSDSKQHPNRGALYSHNLSSETIITLVYHDVTFPIPYSPLTLNEL